MILSPPKKRPAYRPAALRSSTLSSLPHSALTTSPPSASPTRSSTSHTNTSSSYTKNNSKNGSVDGVTRSHWIPDEGARCGTCKTSFGIRGRHHCRKCGLIFCDSHSKYSIRLDADAEFNDGGVECRSCAPCRREYEVWRTPKEVVGMEEEEVRVPTDWTWSTF